MRTAKIVSVSVVAGALAGFTASAFAGSGVRGVFNLGEPNTVDAETTLTGATGGSPHLRVENAATSQTAFGVIGRMTAGNTGTQSAGVKGINSGTNGNGFGVWGFHQSGGTGVFGESTNGTGVLGKGSKTGGSLFSSATAVYGCASPSGSPACPSSPFFILDAIGGQFRTMAPNGVGLLACTGGGGNCSGESGSPIAGEFSASGSHAKGVTVEAGPGAPGLQGGIGVVSHAYGPGAIGVSGEATGGIDGNGVGVGVKGVANTGPGAVGVLGSSSNGLAGRFEGNVHVTGTITRDYSAGTAKRATPIAYAFVNSAGSVGANASSSNVTSTFDSVNNRYDITITGETYNLNNYVTTVTTTGGTTPLIATTQASGGHLLIRIFKLSGAAVQSGFGFVIYKP